MRLFFKTLVGAGVLAAIAGTAIAADRVHVLRVAMPDGSVAQIRYLGDVPPQIVVAPVAAPGDADSPFAMMDRIAFEMDRQADAMLRQVAAMRAAPPAMGGQLDRAVLAAMPAGAVHYSMTSFSTGSGGTCNRSVQVTSLGSGQPPKVVQRSSGDCSAVATRTPTPAVERAAPAPSPITAVNYAPEHPKRTTPII